MNAYIFFADGFEETEAITPLDLLLRVGINIKTVGVGSREIRGAHGVTVFTDLCTCEISPDDCDVVILPGGMPGTLNLASNDTVSATVDEVAKKGGLVCAICAAPSILGEKGLLKGKRATCYPGFEDKLIGASVAGDRVCVDGNIITAKGAGAAAEFGLAIVKYLCGQEVADKLAHTFIANVD